MAVWLCGCVAVTWKRLTPGVVSQFFTMGIEYHHIHHMFTKVPGYRLRECHEQAPEGLWQGINKLGYRDMLESLSCECFDEKKGRYGRFP